MDIVIETGFEKVTHSITFNPEGLKKAKQLCKSDHVCYVKEYRSNGVSQLIEGYVIRQTSVCSAPYKVQLQLDSSRHVTVVTCECVANKSGKCKHVCALINFVNNTESLTKTSFEQVWGKPTARQLGTVKYAKGKFFNQMFPPKNKIKVEAFKFSLDDLKEDCPLRSALLEERKDKVHYYVMNMLVELFDSIFIKYDENVCDTCLENFFIFKEESEVYKSKNVGVIDDSLITFYETNIVLSKVEVMKLCKDTLLQSNCAKWYSARLMRLSASKDVHSIKILKTKTVESLVNEMLNPKKVNTPAMRYGKINEKVALSKYSNTYNCTVFEIGVFVCTNQPWLCASVDGVVVKDGCVDRLIEIKCPITCEKCCVVDFEKKISNVPYLKFYNDYVELSESSIYYTRCQIQMYVTGLTVCDLYVYSPLGSCLVEVQRNESFLKIVVPKCEDFYFKYYLRELYQKSLNTKNAKRTFTGTDVKNVYCTK